MVYKILTESNKPYYTGKAKRGRVQERLNEHLGRIPGVKIQIEQMSTINDAGKKEVNIIKRSKPKYNKIGK